MIVTGAFLAEAASVADDKLFVLGGGLTRWNVGAGPDERLVTPVLVIFGQADPDETEATVRVEIRFGIHPEPAVIELQISTAALGPDGGFSIAQIRMDLPEDGRYVILVGGTVSIPLNVVTAR